MPEENKRRYMKVAKKAYLYKNEKKQEGSKQPDYTGKVVELDLNELKEVADEDNKVTLSLSGWIEEDQEGTKRVGIQVQKVTGEAPKAVVAGTEAAPF
jgi:hypothetical protein